MEKDIEIEELKGIEYEKWIEKTNEKLFKKPFFYKLNNTITPAFYKNFANYILDFEVYKTDTWIVTFPKCGTIMLQEMAWLIGNDLNYEGAKEFISNRFPFIESSGFFLRPYLWENLEDVVDRNGNVNIPSESSFGKAASMKEPRFIKSHLPLSLLPRALLKINPKIIYLIRNPRDVCVSYYHHWVLFFGYKGSLNDFVDAFINDLVLFQPYFSHVEEFWKIRNQENVLFLTYEEMTRNLKDTITKVAQFMGKELSGDEIEKLAKHLSFENMKNNPSVNLEELASVQSKFLGTEQKTDYLRKGKVGGWKEELSLEASLKLDQYVKANKERVSGLFQLFDKF